MNTAALKNDLPLTGKTILLVDDTPAIRTFLRISLQVAGAVVEEASNAEEALLQAAATKPDFIVLDLGLPDRDGLDILPLLKETPDGGRAPAIIILSVRRDQGSRERAIQLGANAYIAKPFVIDDLMTALLRLS